MRRERGMVTAELMTIAPFGVAFAFLLLWIVSLGLTQVRLADASRESARMVARGERADDAAAMARRFAPPGASVRLTTRTCWMPRDSSANTTASAAPPAPSTSASEASAQPARRSSRLAAKP